MKKIKKVIVYNKGKLLDFDKKKHNPSYQNPKFFVGVDKTADVVITSSEKVKLQYKKDMPDVPVYTSVEELYGKSDQGTSTAKKKEDSAENVVEDTLPASEPASSEPEEPKDDKKDTALESASADEFELVDNKYSHDEIRSQPFFTQKKLVKEQYGVSAKNKEEIEQILSDNPE